METLPTDPNSCVTKHRGASQLRIRLGIDESELKLRDAGIHMS